MNRLSEYNFKFSVNYRILKLKGTLFINEFWNVLVGEIHCEISCQEESVWQYGQVQDVRLIEFGHEYYKVNMHSRVPRSDVKGHFRLLPSLQLIEWGVEVRGHPQ